MKVRGQAKGTREQERRRSFGRPDNLIALPQELNSGEPSGRRRHSRGPAHYGGACGSEEGV